MREARRIAERRGKPEECNVPWTPAPSRQESDSLPEGWRCCALGEIAAFERGVSWGKTDESPGGIPVVAIPNVRNDHVGWDIRYRIARQVAPAKCLQIGDILLVGSSGSSQNIGRTASVTELPFPRATFASFLVKAVPHDDLDRHFLRFLLSGPTIDFCVISKRAADGKYNLQVQGLKKVAVPIPPLPEQRTIATVLRTVQEAKEACGRVIAATRQLKLSLLHYVFTYGSVPFDQADHVPLKETGIGPIPEHWEVVALSELSTRVQYGTSTRCDADVTGYPVLRIPNVVGGRVDTTDLKYLAASPADAERYLLHSGDLLFVRTNGVRENVGRCAVYQGKPGRALFASYLIRVLLSANRALPAFVQLFTETSSGRASFRERASGAADGKFNINSQTIRATPIPLPPLPEQLTIASHLSAVDAKLAAEEARRVALDNLFKSLLHHLMTGRVRVNHLVDQLAGQSTGEETS